MGDKGAGIPWAPCRVTGLRARANPSKAPVRADALASADPAPQSDFMDLPFPLPVTRRVRRVSAVLATTAAAGVVGSLVLAGPAQAAAGCTTTTPTLDQLISCVTAGSETITIPVGANRVEVVVIGGGGGGGTSVGGATAAGGSGGSGASVSGTLIVVPGGALAVTVGAGGPGAQGGGGGQFSSLSAASTLLVVSGGGGGGGLGLTTAGGDGGAGGASGAAGGGDGGDQGTSTTNGGSGGSGGVGGPSGSGGGTQGADWSAGGGGGTGWGATSGYGGSGYGGGGGGGTWSGTYTANPGGGAGGSYANPSFLIGTAVFAPASGSAGQGGAGAALGSGVLGSAGTAGSITLIFRYVADPAVAQAVLLPAAQLQQIPMPASGSCSDIDESTLDWGSSVTGGWSQSWAEWANGAVCTRTFTYDAATSSWRV